MGRARPARASSGVVVLGEVGSPSRRRSCGRSRGRRGRPPRHPARSARRASVSGLSERTTAEVRHSGHHWQNGSVQPGAASPSVAAPRRGASSAWPGGRRRARQPAARRAGSGRVGGLGRGPPQALEQAGGLVGDRADLLVPALSAHWPTAPRRARTARAALRCPRQHSGRRSGAAPTGRVTTRRWSPTSMTRSSSRRASSTSPAVTSGSGRVRTKSSPSASTRVRGVVTSSRRSGTSPLSAVVGRRELGEGVGADRLAGEVGRRHQRDPEEGLAHLLQPSWPARSPTRRATGRPSGAGGSSRLTTTASTA